MVSFFGMRIVRTKTSFQDSKRRVSSSLSQDSIGLSWSAPPRHPPRRDNKRLTFQHLKDMLGETVFDLSVSGYRLCSFRVWILIPVMSAPVAYEETAHFFDLSDEVSSLHATRSSPTR